MTSRLGTIPGIALAAAFVLAGAVAAAESGEGTMTVEQAKNLPGVVSVTQADGSVAYYKDYNDYNAGKPVAVEKEWRPLVLAPQAAPQTSSTTQSTVSPVVTNTSSQSSGFSSDEEEYEYLMRTLPKDGYGGSTQTGKGPGRGFFGLNRR